MNFIGDAMSNNDVEIELKFPLLNPDEVRKYLNKSAEIEYDGLFQKDSYYTPPDRNFMGFEHPYEWLRLRETPNGASINYKHFHPENVKWTDYCEEFETEIGKIEKVEKIFESLKFRKIVVVEKHRGMWIYKNTEVAIDDVEELGSFIELEAMGSFEDPKEGNIFLFDVLKTLNAKVGPQGNKGYPHLLLEKRGKR